MGFKTFETERLRLRPTNVNDAPFILELLNTPKFIKYIADRNVRTIADAKTYIEERMLPQLKRLGYANYTVIRKSDDTKLGTCGLYSREEMEGIDIGFSFLPQHEKQGYAFEAARCILDAAFNEFNIDEISAITTEENLSSQRLIKKLGLNYKDIVHLANDTEDLWRYQLKRNS
ncbi:GNAT family N-acetyltransferase [Ichthyenterobacterium sp. W332]|uniref:GNAT family N-acetyltransferase n=1 Tax=Microcosmobacter mediterraneus TaxID=3075607 RepID=A0ABU2YIB8_9FLAO|nr:GNAT family N-acetyltransferase [Ichthyenterobacterium sp. W332]MDT0557917.1 GNAT family N-acetyltransferase [Ichthyenterobacterium sp. W332]